MQQWRWRRVASDRLPKSFQARPSATDGRRDYKGKVSTGKYFLKLTASGRHNEEKKMSGSSEAELYRLSWPTQQH